MNVSTMLEIVESSAYKSEKSHLEKSSNFWRPISPEDSRQNESAFLSEDEEDYYDDVRRFIVVQWPKPKESFFKP